MTYHAKTNKPTRPSKRLELLTLRAFTDATNRRHRMARPVSYYHAENPAMEYSVSACLVCGLTAYADSAEADGARERIHGEALEVTCRQFVRQHSGGAVRE